MNHIETNVEIKQTEAADGMGRVLDQRFRRQRRHCAAPAPGGFRDPDDGHRSAHHRAPHSSIFPGGLPGPHAGGRCDWCSVRFYKEVAETEIQKGNIAIMVDRKSRNVFTNFSRMWLWMPFWQNVILEQKITDAPFVVGVGRGLYGGRDYHCVVETKRGHYLGRCIWKAVLSQITGIPGLIGGYGLERLIKAPVDGIFKGDVKIGAEEKRRCSGPCGRCSGSGTD